MERERDELRKMCEEMGEFIELVFNYLKDSCYSLDQEMCEKSSAILEKWRAKK